MSIDNQILESLSTLITASREKAREANQIFYNREVQDRLLELYDESGLVASLTHQVLMNREVAHSFCITLRGIKDLWNKEEVQLAFAEALRKGDTLLIDAISFIKQYRDVPVIQEAIAYNIATCSSMLFQISVACGIGLCNHPSIKQAILGRKKDVIERIRENWHESVCLTSTPYLIHDAEVRQVLNDARKDMIREIIKEEHLVDVSFLIRELEWLRHDTKIVAAIRERISDISTRLDYIFMKTLRDYGMFQQYPELMDALNLHDDATRKWILEVI
ncbi:MAG: hypothetical protein ACFFE6_01545 [Candidatus Thorarchaeota archaeon]